MLTFAEPCAPPDRDALPIRMSGTISMNGSIRANWHTYVRASLFPSIQDRFFSSDGEVWLGGAL